ERGAGANRVARPERAVELQLELERREAAALVAHVAWRDPEHRGGMAVGGREAMDVVRQGDLAEHVDLVRLDGVARGLVEALEPARPRPALAGRDVPLDPPPLGRAP